MNNPPRIGSHGFNNMPNHPELDEGEARWKCCKCFRFTVLYESCELPASRNVSKCCRAAAYRWDNEPTKAERARHYAKVEEQAVIAAYERITEGEDK